MYLTYEQAVSAVNAFNGIGKSKGLSYKDHLLGNWAYILISEQSGSKHLWESLLAGPLADITEEDSKELVERIYKFWHTTPYGDMEADAPSYIPDTHGRLIEVGLVDPKAVNINAKHIGDK